MVPPALIVAAPSTGSGKTTVVCAIAAALAARPPGSPGRDVRLFKAGPDYLDPTWHTKVTGRPSRNLDAWMTGADGVIASYRRGAAGGDLALVEGVMGLFDGWSPTELTGSGAELALLLGAPVLLVVDASGMARTAAAVVHGLATFDPRVRVAGVVFNRVGGEGHTRILREATAAALPGVAVLGGLPARPELAVPERHLGLVAADLVADPGWIARLAVWAGDHLDLDALVGLAGGGAKAEVSPGPPIGRRARIGIARDAAFHFYYVDNLELLEAAGAELVPFSPLTDAALPAVDGLYLGGGYPEEHAAALSANTPMRAAIRAFADAGRPIYAECGGLMYLGEALATDGAEHPMCGVLPLRTRMTPSLRSFGYREVVTTEPTLFGPAGTRWKGHEFHHSELVEATMTPAFTTKGWGGAGVEGWATRRVLGTYVHAHFGSNPGMAVALVEGCRREG